MPFLLLCRGVWAERNDFAVDGPVGLTKRSESILRRLEPCPWSILMTGWLLIEILLKLRSSYLI